MKDWDEWHKWINIINKHTKVANKGQQVEILSQQLEQFIEKILKTIFNLS